MLNELHYSQAVKIGDRVETSGQGGWDDNLQIPESLANEIAQAFWNVEQTLMYSEEISEKTEELFVKST